MFDIQYAAFGLVKHQSPLSNIYSTTWKKIVALTVIQSAAVLMRNSFGNSAFTSVLYRVLTKAITANTTTANYRQIPSIVPIDGCEAPLIMPVRIENMASTMLQ